MLQSFGVHRPLAAISVLLALGACTRESPSLAGDRALREGRYEEAETLGEQIYGEARERGDQWATGMMLVLLSSLRYAPRYNAFSRATRPSGLTTRSPQSVDRS